jgi:ParB/RepB/Spo0J family partition protein
MNAPAPAAAIEPQALEHVALASLTPSRTHIQELRRARFDKNALAELAVSIGKVGILQAIVARPLAGSDSKFEIVAGERRYLAAKQAGLAVLPVNVRELSDDQVLEVQLIENLQREDLHELEEAEGYDELMKLKKINADALAGMVGKSRSYVYARTKLLALCPEARKAFYAGELDASTALEIARIPPHELQRKAMKDLAQQREWGEITNFRDAREWLRENYMLKLKAAPFDRADVKLVPAAGSCAACPKRSGNQPDLMVDMKDADVCTDPKCFDDKRQAHYATARKALEAKGAKVIYGDAAKKIMPRWEDEEDYVAGGYKRLNDTTYVGNASRKIADVLGKDHVATLVQHPATGKIIEVASEQAIAKASTSKPGAKSSGSGTSHTSWHPKQKTGPDVDDMLNDRLAKLIHEKAPKEFGRSWLLVLAQELREQLSLRNEDSVAKAWGWKESAFTGSRGYGRSLPAEANKLSERDLVLLMFDMVFACGPYTRDGVLKQFGIKEPTTRDLIIEERKAAQRKAREDAKAKKEAAKKPAPAAAKIGTKWPFPTSAKSSAHQAAKKKPGAKKKAIAKKSAKKKPA